MLDVIAFPSIIAAKTNAQIIPIYFTHVQQFTLSSDVYSKVIKKIIYDALNG